MLNYAYLAMPPISKLISNFSGSLPCLLDTLWNLKTSVLCEGLQGMVTVYNYGYRYRIIQQKSVFENTKYG